MISMSRVIINFDDGDNELIELALSTEDLR